MTVRLRRLPRWLVLRVRGRHVRYVPLTASVDVRERFRLSGGWTR